MRSLAFAVGLAMVSLSALSGEGGQRSYGLIAVVATVQPSAVVKYEFQTSELSVRPVDISRGYIDVFASSLLSVNAGKISPIVVVNVAPTDGPFKSVEVWTAEPKVIASALIDKLPIGRAAKLNRGDIDLIRAQFLTLERPVEEQPTYRLRSSAGEAVLNYRIKLSEQAKSGRYIVPLTIEITL